MGKAGFSCCRDKRPQAESESAHGRLDPPAKPGKEHKIDNRERIQLRAEPCSQQAASGYQSAFAHRYSVPFVKTHRPPAHLFRRLAVFVLPVSILTTISMP